MPRVRERVCVFCRKDTDDEVNYGKMERTKNISAHYYCVLLSKTIKQCGEDHEGIWGFRPSDILTEVRKSKKNICSYCYRPGANLACNHEKCKRKFHLPCGMKKGSLHDFKYFVCFCNKHRRRTNVPSRMRLNINNYICIICMENFIRQTDLKTIIWANCCKGDTLFHLDCMKKLALNTGYYTRCPCCNNTETFLNTVKSYGVFVPERDASWEMNEDTYADLYHVNMFCDAEKCICPDGRNSDSYSWPITLCSFCGSFGAHKKCTKFKKYYVCGVCSSINNKTHEIANTIDEN